MALACMRNFSSCLSICSFTNFSIGSVKRGAFSVRLMNASVNVVDYVQQSMVHSKTLTNVLFSIIILIMLPMYRLEAFFVFSYISLVLFIKSTERMFMTACSVASWRLLAYSRLASCAIMRRSCLLRRQSDSTSRFGATGADCPRDVADSSGPSRPSNENA